MATKKVHDNYHDGVHDRTIVYEREDGSKRVVDQRVIHDFFGEFGATNTGERIVPADED